MRPRHKSGVRVRVRGVNITVSVLMLGLLAVCMNFSPANARVLVFGMLGAVVHELGHMLAFCVVGDRIKEITVGLSGISLSTCGLIGSRSRQLFTLAMGPSFNLALMLVFAKSPELVAANAALAAFNLLPVSSLDGGRMLALFCPQRLCSAVSTVFLAALALGGVALCLGLGNYSLIITAIYLIFIQ